MHDRSAAVLWSWRGAAFTAWRSVSGMALEDEIHTVFKGLTHSGNEDPHHDE